MQTKRSRRVYRARHGQTQRCPELAHPEALALPGTQQAASAHDRGRENLRAGGRWKSPL